jgi:hypothetical protein
VHPPLLLVDGRNVQRSAWPNVEDDELVRLVGRWAAQEGVDAVVAFDGPMAASCGRGGPDVVAVQDESADDWLVRAASEAAAGGRTVWLATSDRELRARAAQGVSRMLGGGGFLRMLRQVAS